MPSWLAVIGAGIAVLLGYRIVQAEHRRDLRQEEAGYRAQAEKVAAWVDADLGPAGEREPVVVARNASDLPIYDVVLTVLTERASRQLPTIAVLPPGEARYGVPGDFLQKVLQDDEVHRSAPLWTITDATMAFRDSSGRHWHRGRNGTLR